MNLDVADPNGAVTANHGQKHLPLALAVVFLLVALAAYGSLASASTGTTALSFSVVQVTLHTTYTTANYTYTVSVYNTTGSLVASYQSEYAAAAFELPSGTYIFTASASAQQSVYATPPITSEASSSTSSGSASSTGVICCVSGEAAGEPNDVCCVSNYPVSEYGYANQRVSGPTTLTISTKPLNETTTSALALRVSYPNGTAAVGVYLSASVLGDSSGLAYAVNGALLSNTTGKQGTATIVAPSVPLLVSAETSIPIVLPSNQTTIRVDVAGVEVNVTAVWEPSYLSFIGQALILPPQTSATIKLQYQAQLEVPIPQGVTTQIATGFATSVSAYAPPASSVSAEASPQQQATGLMPSQPGVSRSEGTNGPEAATIAALAGAISAVALGAALFASKARAGSSLKK